MKWNKKNIPHFLLLLFLGLVSGSLFWELLEKILTYLGLPLALSLGPMGVDLRAVSFFIRVNPGSFLGMAAGFALFRSL